MAKLVRNVRFRTIFLDGSRALKIASAPAGKRFTAQGVEEILARAAAQLEQYFPGREFRLVPLADGNFNFVEMTKEEAELRAKREELREQHGEQVPV